jgi:hypothetical protein
MPNIIDRLTAAWRGRDSSEQVATTPVAPANSGSLQTAVVNFNTSRVRRDRVHDSREMVENDPRPEQSIATLARDVTKGGFTLQLSGPRAEEAQTAADELLARLDLNQRLDDWLRLTLRDGDSFLEVGASSSGQIVQVTRKPTLEMYRHSNQHDGFEDPAKAFFWTDLAYGEEPPPSAVWFAEWQIIHARWNSDEGSRYGRPLFTSARKPFKRMTQGELDLAVRRKTRSGLRYVHTLEDASPADIETYRAMNKPALDDPFAAVADFFMNKRGGIQAIQGDARLSELDDVLHHVDTFGLASPVPLELIGYGRNLNRDVLEQKKAQYDETIASVRQWLQGQIVLPLLHRQWLFMGIWPDALTVDVQWKTKKDPTSATLVDVSRFVATIKAANMLTTETLLRVLATFLPDFDIEAELAALDAEAVEREEMALRIATNASTPPQQDSSGEERANGSTRNNAR